MPFKLILSQAIKSDSQRELAWHLGPAYSWPSLREQNRGKGSKVRYSSSDFQSDHFVMHGAVH